MYECDCPVGKCIRCDLSNLIIIPLITSVKGVCGMCDKSEGI